MSWEILQGDCIEVMAEMKEVSVDAVVCDPPYGIGFMGKAWDAVDIEVLTASQASKRQRPDGRTSMASPAGAADTYDLSLTANRRYQGWCEAWAREAFRVLKPGGHLLASCGTRTYHRLAAGVEDAGFEIRDSLLWLYGSGFPKSLDVSKAIDKAAGAEREVVGRYAVPADSDAGNAGQVIRSDDAEGGFGGNITAGREGTPITAPATSEAEQWDGWGTALKPSHEPIVVARKPLIGTVAETVLEHGTGAINVDACRIEAADELGDPARFDGQKAKSSEGWRRPSHSSPVVDERQREAMERAATLGRWPANVVLSHHEDCEPVGVRVLKGDQRDTGNGKRPGGFGDVGAEVGDDEPNAVVYGDETVTEWRCRPGCPVAELDAQSGVLHSQDPATRRSRSKVTGVTDMGTGRSVEYADRGGASRFFYCAKTSRAERNAGLEGFEEKPGGMRNNVGRPLAGHGVNPQTRNSHPTVKPINLMRWLVRLVTPPGGTVLDPFLGSGSTGCAAVLEGFDFIGIEREAEYVEIAEARIAFWAQHEGREVEDVLGLYSASQRQAKAHAKSGQLDLEAAQP